MQHHWIDDVFVRDADIYLAVYLHTLTSRTSQAVDGLIEALNLTPEQHILDLACGHGRHAIELARRGYAHITGLDYTPSFLEKARQDAEAAEVSVRWLHGDMRALALVSEFDVVYNLFTSLFYFDEETNQAVLNNIGRALRPGGRFLLDTMNSLRVIRQGVTRGWEQLPNGGWLLERWRYEPRTGRTEMERHILLRDGQHVSQEFFIRLYTVPELERMLQVAGLQLTGVNGDANLQPYSIDSTRLVALAEKA